MLTTLYFVWELDEEFEGIRDYQTLGNKLTEEGELPRWRSTPCTLHKRMQEGMSCTDTSELPYLPLE